MTLTLSPRLHDEIPELVPEGSERLRVGLAKAKSKRVNVKQTQSSEDSD